MSSAGPRKIRARKLTQRTCLAVLRADQVDSSEYESLDANVATGIEQAEEKEVHLQSVLQGAGIASDHEIPVPPPQESELNYSDLYAQTFSKTVTYIRFSQTVEECIGCMYDMTDEDAAFLKTYNQKRPAAPPLSDDDFERIMEVFEDTAHFKTPFASVDQTIVPYDDMVQGLQHLETSSRFSVMPHAKDLYEYWKSRRQAFGNRALHATLKFETHQESDELDPYVCFRRREVRQTRKTRARDVQSVEKLKRLRQELEEGRQLISATCKREDNKLELLKVDRAIFEQRAHLKEHKKRLGIKTHDEDLINVKPKTKRVELPAEGRQAASMLQANASRSNGRPVDSELLLLSTRNVEKERELAADLAKKVQNHQEWNRNHIDLTQGPLSPVRGQAAVQSFRSAITHYLMTPPNSASSESMEEPDPMDLDTPGALAVVPFKGVYEHETTSGIAPAYRRRVGRLNRLWIDRRGLASPPVECGLSDRWKYDHESDEDGDAPMYKVDPFDTSALRFRASIPLPTGWNGNRAVQQNPRGMPLQTLDNNARPVLQPVHHPPGGHSYVVGGT